MYGIEYEDDILLLLRMIKFLHNSIFSQGTFAG